MDTKTALAWLRRVCCYVCEEFKQWVQSARNDAFPLCRNQRILNDNFLAYTDAPPAVAAQLLPVQWMVLKVVEVFFWNFQWIILGALGVGLRFVGGWLLVLVNKTMWGVLQSKTGVGFGKRVGKRKGLQSGSLAKNQLFGSGNYGYILFLGSA